MKPKTLASNRLAVVVPLLALLAMALVPMAANAETAAEKVYIVEPAKVHSIGPEEGDAVTQHPSHPKPPADASPKKHDAAPPATNEGTPPGESEPPTTNHTHHAGAAPKGGNDHPGGNGDPRSGASPGPEATTGAGTKGVRTSPRATDPEPATTDSGGSSPVLPILIAMAALAALSIGIAVYRQRGPDGGSVVDS